MQVCQNDQLMSGSYCQNNRLITLKLWILYWLAILGLSNFLLLSLLILTKTKPWNHYLNQKYEKLIGYPSEPTVLYGNQHFRLECILTYSGHSDVIYDIHVVKELQFVSVASLEFWVRMSGANPRYLSFLTTNWLFISVERQKY